MCCCPGLFKPAAPRQSACEVLEGCSNPGQWQEPAWPNQAQTCRRTEPLMGSWWCGVVWCGVVWCGVVWCGVVWCGVVWCGVVWCGVV